MKKKELKRYKIAKQDYTEAMLPQTRRAVFFDVFKHLCEKKADVQSLTAFLCEDDLDVGRNISDYIIVKVKLGIVMAVEGAAVNVRTVTDILYCY